MTVPGFVPVKYISQPCPCCGHPQQILNGPWLAYQRQTAGLDQRALAKVAGVSGPYLSDIERNRHVAPDRVVEAYLMATKRKRKRGF